MYVLQSLNIVFIMAWQPSWNYSNKISLQIVYWWDCHAYRMLVGLPCPLYVGGIAMPIICWWDCHAHDMLVGLPCLSYVGGIAMPIVCWWDCHAYRMLVGLPCPLYVGGIAMPIVCWWDCHAHCMLVGLPCLSFVGGIAMPIVCWWDCHAYRMLVGLPCPLYVGGIAMPIVCWWDCHAHGMLVGLPCPCHAEYWICTTLRPNNYPDNLQHSSCKHLLFSIRVENSVDPAHPQEPYVGLCKKNKKTLGLVYLGLDAKKPVFGASDKARLLPVSSATETGWSAHLLFPNPWRQVLSWRGPYVSV